MAEQLKLAFVGCGAIARFHLNGIAEMAPDIQLTAVVDTMEEKTRAYAAETGATPVASLDEAREQGDFDAVDIMLPHDLHEEFALRAFAAGKHVLLETPMAPTPAGCDRILAAAREAGTVFMVAENSQYWPEIVKAKELVDAGAIGDILTARAGFVMEFDDYWVKEGKPWRYEKQRTGGGIVVDGGAHWIRPMRMWLGEIDEVVAVVGHPLAEMENESFARALLRFESGVVAVFDALHAGDFIGPGEEFRVTGTRGELVIEKGAHGNLIRYDRAHPGGEVIQAKHPGRGAPSFGYELHDFSLAVLEGKTLAAGPEYSLGELRTALAIYRSAETRQWEKVWD